ncbi:MAG: Zn-ribbon domain-containing protein [Methanothrix sp.]|nr:Zn-ribbon domain-containing protein [Methanothrix sp.]
MPHICTRCKNVFDSGEDILKGCPNCGWKKFMFVRKGQQDSGEAEAGPIITRAMGVRVPPGEARKNRSEAAVEQMQASQQAPQESANAAPLSPSAQTPLERKIDDAPQPHPDEGHDLQDSLKIEGKVKSDGKSKSHEKTLESVKITAPGTYELNLPSLFERDELIMAVKEGTYFIDLASVFKKSKKD